MNADSAGVSFWARSGRAVRGRWLLATLQYSPSAVAHYAWWGSRHALCTCTPDTSHSSTLCHSFATTCHSNSDFVFQTCRRRPPHQAPPWRRTAASPSPAAWRPPPSRRPCRLPLPLAFPGVQARRPGRGRGSGRGQPPPPAAVMRRLEVRRRLGVVRRGRRRGRGRWCSCSCSGRAAAARRSLRCSEGRCRRRTSGRVSCRRRRCCRC